MKDTSRRSWQTAMRQVEGHPQDRHRPRQLHERETAKEYGLIDEVPRPAPRARTRRGVGCTRGSAHRGSGGGSCRPGIRSSRTAEAPTVIAKGPLPCAQHRRRSVSNPCARTDRERVEPGAGHRLPRGVRAEEHIACDVHVQTDAAHERGGCFARAVRVSDPSSALTYGTKAPTGSMTSTMGMPLTAPLSPKYPTNHTPGAITNGAAGIP